MYNVDEDMLAEHQAAKVIAEAIEAEAERVRMEARRAELDREFAERNRLRILKKLTWFVPIATHVFATRVAVLDQEKCRLTIDGIDVTSQVTDKEAYSSGRWGRPTGKTTLSVGSYGQTTSYPQRKDGTWNYASIVEKLLRYVDSEKAKIKAQQQAAANRGLAKDLVEGLNLPELQSLVRPSSQHEGRVVVDLTQLYTKQPTMSPEKARELLEVLRTFGVKLSYKG